MHPPGPPLTDAQRQCLKDAGLEKPADGQRPTDAQREAFRAAAAKCGIDLPKPPPDGGQPGNQGNDGQGDNQNSSTQNASV